MGKSQNLGSIQRLGNSSGFSLVEVMVAVGIMAVLIAAMTTLIEFMEKSKSQNTLTQNMTLMQSKIQSLILNDNAWDESIGSLTDADPLNLAVPPLVCIPNGTGCIHTVKPVPATNPPDNAYYLGAPFVRMHVLAEPNGNRYLDTSLPGNGFTADGTPCTTFNPGAGLGTDDCPVRWQLRLAMICPNAVPTCINPTVEVVAVLRYNPSPNNSRFKPINVLKYRVQVTRGSRGKNRSEQFEASFGGTGQFNGGGLCTLNAWSNITFDNLDKNENTNAALAGANITVQPGTYNCSFTVSCFECGGQ